MTEHELYTALKDIRDLHLNYTVRSARLQLIMEWLRKENVQYPSYFNAWFDSDGVPKTPSREKFYGGNE